MAKVGLILGSEPEAASKPRKRRRQRRWNVSTKNGGRK
jgi:hypothetical protein